MALEVQILMRNKNRISHTWNAKLKPSFVRIHHETQRANRLTGTEAKRPDGYVIDPSLRIRTQGHIEMHPYRNPPRSPWRYPFRNRKENPHSFFAFSRWFARCSPTWTLHFLMIRACSRESRDFHDLSKFHHLHENLKTFSLAVGFCVFFVKMRSFQVKNVVPVNVAMHLHNVHNSKTWSLSTWQFTKTKKCDF